MDDQACARLRATPAFQELERTRGRLGWTLTALILIVYFGFVLLVAFAPALMGKPVFGTMTLGFPLGLGVILCAVLFTGVYVLRANSRFDVLTRQIVAEAR